MTIGIDIDDVITESSLIISEYIEKYGKDNGAYEEFLEHGKEIMRGRFNYPAMKPFMDEHFNNMVSIAKTKDNVKEVIDYLRNKGHKIYLITSRGETLMKGNEKVTNDYLEKKNIEYDKLILNAHDKLQECVDNKVDLMIDDSIDICTKLESNGISNLLFTSIINKDFKTDLKRVFNWLEIKELIDKYE